MPHNLLKLLLITAVASLNTQCQTVSRTAVEKGRSPQTSTPLPSEAQTNTFNENLFVNARNERMRYLLFVPKDYDKQNKYPLVLWLHGGGSRGDDLKLLLKYGDEHGIGFFARPDNQ